MAALFGGKKAPDPKPPAPMPDNNDPAVMAAERKRRQGMMARGGRASTILSGDGGMGGMQEYSKDKMG